MLKLFAFAFKFTAKKLGGAVGRLMDYTICRRQMSSLYVIEVECSILRINHWFQNGRALLKCQIFLPPTCTQITDITKITHSRQGPVLHVQITAPCLRP
jgi:hypothetical protein